MRAMMNTEKSHRRIARNERAIDPSRMLDVLLALDRMVVEVSMHLYNVESSNREQGEARREFQRPWR